MKKTVIAAIIAVLLIAFVPLFALKDAEFGGSDDAPVAYVEVNVFGTSVPKSAWEKLTPQIMDALQDTLNVPADRTYIRYTGTADWGWNGGNF